MIQVLSVSLSLFPALLCIIYMIIDHVEMLLIQTFDTEHNKQYSSGALDSTATVYPKHYLWASSTQYIKNTRIVSIPIEV